MAALTVSETLLTRQICRKLVFGLSKREIWNGWEIEQATSMYTLSLAADDSAGLLEDARVLMRNQVGDVPPPPDPRLEQARSRFASAMEELLSLRPASGSQPVELFMRLA